MRDRRRRFRRRTTSETLVGIGMVVAGNIVQPRKLPRVAGGCEGDAARGLRLEVAIVTPQNQDPPLCLCLSLAVSLPSLSPLARASPAVVSPRFTVVYRFDCAIAIVADFARKEIAFTSDVLRHPPACAHAL